MLVPLQILQMKGTETLKR